MRKALLIGSQTGDLQGCHYDVAQMADTLSRFGFEEPRKLTHDATRAHILEEIARMQKDAREDDVLVFYYSGHGGLAENPNCNVRDPKSPRHFQTLVPVDMHETTEADFRGILDLELAIYFYELSQKCPNVVAILDCCYGAQMIRQGMRLKTITDIWPLSVAAMSLQVELPPHNPYVVRLTAAERFRVAVEVSLDYRGSAGLFTHNLTNAMNQLGDQKISWRTLIQIVRLNVQNRNAQDRNIHNYHVQRPGVEGPWNRLLFETEERRLHGVLMVDCPMDEVPRLNAGSLQGLRVGDTYALTEPEAEVLDQVLGEVRVTAVEATTAVFELVDPKEKLRLYTGLRAYSQSMSFELMPVHLDVPQLRSMIEAHAELRIAQDERAVKVVCEDGLFCIVDADGFPYFPTPDIHKIVSNLEVMARAERVRQLADRHDLFDLKDQGFVLEWGLVEDGRAMPWSPVLRPGQAVYLKMINYDHEMLYFNALDVGVSGRVSLVDASRGFGFDVPRGSEEVLGKRAYDAIRGLKLCWPQDVPQNREREETLIVVVSDAPINLSSLEQRGVLRSGRLRLEQLFGLAWNVRCGASKSQGRFRMERIDFILDPT